MVLFFIIFLLSFGKLLTGVSKAWVGNSSNVPIELINPDSSGSGWPLTKKSLKVSYIDDSYDYATYRIDTINKNYKMIFINIGSYQGRGKHGNSNNILIINALPTPIMISMHGYSSDSYLLQSIYFDTDLISGTGKDNNPISIQIYDTYLLVSVPVTIDDDDNISDPTTFAEMIY